MSDIGFVLQAGYRMERGRPVVDLVGVLEGGGTFRIRDGRERPRFWIRAVDANAAARLGAAPLTSAPPRGSMTGDPLVRVETDAPSDLPVLRERLESAGIPTFEADVRFAHRYLLERGIRGSLRIAGPRRPGAGTTWEYLEPEVGPADWSPTLSVLSFDIETDPRGRTLLSIALHGCGADEVVLLTPEGMDCPPGAIACPDEATLIARFAQKVRKLDPDVLTGWNVVDFDLATLVRIAEAHRVRLDLGRGPGPVRIRETVRGRGDSRAEVPGRLVLDGMALVRGAFLRFDSYALHAVATEVLGRGKLLHGDDRAEAILEMWRHDRPRFVEYNRVDAHLVTDILERLRLVDLAVERSRLTGMTPDRVAASIASFDFLYLSELSRRGICAPTLPARPDADLLTSGGHVLDPRPGLYRNVLVLDFKSLYPSIIRTFQIDPLGLVAPGRPCDDPIVAPNGASFRRDPGILPAILDDLFPRREAARARGDAVASQAIKILMNSFYGVLGTPACRFASPALANAITGFGREILLWTKARIERIGLEVLYGDTDSLFVRAGTDDPDDADAIGSSLAARLTADLAAHTRERWRVESRLELQFETLYLRLLLPELRHGAGGARKRYAGLVRDADGATRVVYRGLEIVRRDWTALAKSVQSELFERLFRDRPVDAWLRDLVGEVRAGAHDDRLVYRKALRKALSEYDGANPPHVVAARLLDGPPGRIVEYVVTTRGPQPASAVDAPLDREHYVQRQIRPIAEPVLAILGLDFDRVVGDDRQGRLF